MVDTKSSGDKTLSMPKLTLKPRVETGTPRQSFSHGRTKQVVVEKRGKRRVFETNSPEDKPLNVSPKPLTLKPHTETGTLRQSFSHGRTTLLEDETPWKRSGAETKM